MALAGLLQVGGNLLLGLFHRQAVQHAGIDHLAGGTVHKGFFLHVASLDHLDDGQAKLLGKFPVAGIVAGHRHDGAGAVGHEDIVGDKDGDLGVVHRVDAHHPLQADAGLVLGHLGALKVALAGGGLLVGADLLQVFQLVGPLLDVGMLGGDDHIGGPVQGVGPGWCRR